MNRTCLKNTYFLLIHQGYSCVLPKAHHQELTNFCDKFSLASVLDEFNIVFDLGRSRLRPGPKALACPDTKQKTTSRFFNKSRYHFRRRSKTPRAPIPNRTQWFSIMPRSFSTSFDILFDSGRLALGWKIRYKTT